MLNVCLCYFLCTCFFLDRNLKWVKNMAQVFKSKANSVNGYLHPASSSNTDFHGTCIIMQQYFVSFASLLVYSFCITIFGFLTAFCSSVQGNNLCIDSESLRKKVTAILFFSCQAYRVDLELLCNQHVNSA